MLCPQKPFWRVKAKKNKFLNFSNCGKGLVFSTLASGLLTVCCQYAEAAMPGTFSEDGRAAVSSKIADRKDALASISGSRWPGVIDHLLQKPTTVEALPLAAIHINYPSLGNSLVDADIRHWVESLARAFESNLDLDSIPLPEAESRLPGHFLQDEDLYSGEASQSGVLPNSFELWGDYKIDRPSAEAVSITFELWNYTGQPQGNLDVLTLNYNLHNGQRLGLVDIFENPDRALELMSAWSRKVLEKRLGNLRAPMLAMGTEPLVENFSSLTLLPDGICINFQPYQVAPWEAGIQKVKMPLEELAEAEPLLSLWGRQEGM